MAVAAAAGALITSTSSSGLRAVAYISAGPRLNAETSRGSQLVAIRLGMNMSVCRTVVEAPYQPTTREFVISESMIVSIHRYRVRDTPMVQNGALSRAILVSARRFVRRSMRVKRRNHTTL